MADSKVQQAGGDNGRGGSNKESSSTHNAAASSSSSVAGNNTVIPSCVPITDKDEMIASLMLRKQQLEKELQGWTDWTNVKVGQAAQKLRMSRQARQETENFEAVLDLNTKKRHSELENELSNFRVEMEVINSAHHSLEAERTKLIQEYADWKWRCVESDINLHEAELREQELQKQLRTLAAETGFLKENLAALKGEGANLEAQLEKARRRQSEFEALRQHEEREKTKFLQEAESLRREREQLMHQAKAEEDNMRAKAEANRLEFEERKNKLTAEISALKLRALGETSVQGGLKREWECVICLTKGRSVVFLPCAHQVLCEECNVLHEKQGMKDCPCCRTPIMKRINACFPPPKAR